MKTSELITILQKAIEKYGDIDIMFENNNGGGYLPAKKISLNSFIGHEKEYICIHAREINFEKDLKGT